MRFFRVMLLASAVAVCAKAAYGQALILSNGDVAFNDTVASFACPPPLVCSQMPPACRPANSDFRLSVSPIEPVSEDGEPDMALDPYSRPPANNAYVVPDGAPTNLQRALCDDSPTWGTQILFGYDSFRGISDGSWQNNGLHVGANLGTRLGAFSDRTGIGFQAGGTMGVLNFNGTDYRPNDNSSAQTQGFVTYGFFRHPNARSKWSAALVQDWMFNDNFGEFSQNPLLSQFRSQLGYAWSAQSEIGLWGTWRVLNASRSVNGAGPTTWRAIDQVNLYYHYKWQPGGADSWVWVGVPEQDRLGGSGNLGDYLLGASANVPLSNYLSLYTLVTYMHPSASAGRAGSVEDAWNFTIGISLYPGRNARSSSVAGQCWMPQLPVANNGYFLVDTSRH